MEGLRLESSCTRVNMVLHYVHVSKHDLMEPSYCLVSSLLSFQEPWCIIELFDVYQLNA
jgi:hypothetical protein